MKTGVQKHCGHILKIKIFKIIYLLFIMCAETTLQTTLYSLYFLINIKHFKRCKLLAGHLMWVDLCRGNENSFDDGNRTFTVEAAAVGATHTGSEVQNLTEQSWEDQSKMCKTMATAEINLQLRKMVPIQFVFICFAAERVRQEIISMVLPVVLRTLSPADSSISSGAYFRPVSL
jgi:hypothetical protein